MRVGRLLQSSEGVDAGVAQGHRVAGSQGRRATFEESRGVAESISQRTSRSAGKQAAWRRRGTNGAACLTRADTTCDETMVAWQGIAQAGIAQASVAYAGVAQAGVARGAVGSEVDAAAHGLASRRW